MLADVSCLANGSTSKLLTQSTKRFHKTVNIKIYKISLSLVPRSFIAIQMCLAHWYQGLLCDSPQRYTKSTSFSCRMAWQLGPRLGWNGVTHQQPIGASGRKRWNTDSFVLTGEIFTLQYDYGNSLSWCLQVGFHLPFPSHVPTPAHGVLSFQLAANCKTKETFFLPLEQPKRHIIKNHSCRDLVALNAQTVPAPSPLPCINRLAHPVDTTLYM